MALVALVLGLSACSSGGGVPTSMPDEYPTSTSEPSGDFEERLMLVTGWAPKIDRSELSDLGGSVARDIEGFTVTHPYPSVVIGYEHEEWVVGCVNHLGVEASLLRSGFGVGVVAKTGDPDSDPSDRGTLVLEACGAYPEWAGLKQPGPGAWIGRKHYDRLVEVNECMREHGFPSSDPPTFESFESTGGAWYPYDTIGGAVAFAGVDVFSATEEDLASLGEEGRFIVEVYRTCPLVGP